jgi:mono/diheme cytochrome c family protein
VLGGMHANTGMAAFKDLLTNEQTENIQAYIVNQARLTGVTTSEASSEQ